MSVAPRFHIVRLVLSVAVVAGCLTMAQGGQAPSGPKSNRTERLKAAPGAEKNAATAEPEETAREKVARREALPDDLKDVVFYAAHYVVDPDSRYLVRATYGEFSLDGPRAATLQSLPQRVMRMTVVAETDERYGIQQQAVVKFVAGSDDVVPLDEGFDVPPLSWPADITFDTKRRRVLLKTSGGGGYLYAFDPASGAWSALAEKPGVEAMTYHPQFDAIFGISLDWRGRPDRSNRAELRRFNPDGGAIQSLPLEIERGEISGGPGVAATQIVPAGKYLAIIASPVRRGRQSSNDVTDETRMYFVDPESGTTLYSTSYRPPPGMSSTPEAPIAAVATESPRPSIPPPLPPDDSPRAADRELHWASIYEGYYISDGKIHGGSADLIVDRPGKLVTLMLSTFDAVTWRIRCSAETTVERVFLCGRGKQRVVGLPDDCPVASLPVIPTFDSFPQPHEINVWPFHRVKEALPSFSNVPLVGFHGQYRTVADKPIVIGSVADDPRLKLDYLTPVLPSNLPDLKFQALHYTRNWSKPLRFEHAGWGEFTLQGPQPEKLAPVTLGLTSIVVDPASKRTFGIFNDETRNVVESALVEVDFVKHSVTPIAIAGDAEAHKYAVFITLDSKRNRLLVQSDVLFAFDLKLNEWTPLGGSHYFRAMTYHPHFDRVFALIPAGGETGQPLDLVEMNANGAVLAQRPLAGNLPYGCFDYCRDMRLYAVDKHLVMLFTPLEGLNGPSYPETWMYLIDPAKRTLTLTMRKNLESVVPGKIKSE